MSAAAVGYTVPSRDGHNQAPAAPEGQGTHPPLSYPFNRKPPNICDLSSLRAPHHLLQLAGPTISQYPLVGS